MGNRSRDAMIGASVAMMAATLFIAATFVGSGVSLAKAGSLLPAAAGYALLASWFIVPLGCVIGVQMERITGQGTLAGVVVRSAVAAMLITIVGSLVFRIPVDVYRLLTGTAPFRDVTTWWADYRGTGMYFFWVGVYSFGWIAVAARYWSRFMSSYSRE